MCKGEAAGKQHSYAVSKKQSDMSVGKILFTALNLCLEQTSNGILQEAGKCAEVPNSRFSVSRNNQCAFR